MAEDPKRWWRTPATADGAALRRVRRAVVTVGAAAIGLTVGVTLLQAAMAQGSQAPAAVAAEASATTTSGLHGLGPTFPDPDSFPFIDAPTVGFPTRRPTSTPVATPTPTPIPTATPTVSAPATPPPATEAPAATATPADGQRARDRP